ncbi:MAG: hypothetical protein DMG16_13085 [Acidobacteria bacterium]|nr:MAG: hypothetical protein DMG16_13085 [Acidobacteriota bacterium]
MHIFGYNTEHVLGLDSSLMRRLLLVTAVITASLGSAFAQSNSKIGTPKRVAVAFFDEERLRNPAGQASLQDFHFFLNQIREIVKRDFPGVELRVLKRGEWLGLPDRTGLNVQNLEPPLGYVLSAKGSKRRLLSGVQSEVDFACAAAAFFHRPSSACIK